MGLPDRDGPLRARPRHQLDVAHHLPRRHPELGAADRQHGRPRRGHRLRAVPRHPAPRVPRPRHDRRGIGRPRRRHGRPGRGLRRRHGRHRDPRPRRRRHPVRDRRRHRHLGDRADHGGRLGHPAAGVPRPRRPPDQRLRAPTRPREAGRTAEGLGLATLGWPRLRHAAAYAVGGTVAAAGAGRTGAGPAARASPTRARCREHRTERRAYDLVADGFGPGINGPLVVAVDISEDPERRRAPGRARSRPTGASPPSRPPRSTPTPAWRRWSRSRPRRRRTRPRSTPIERLRAEVLPSVLDESPARAHVGGQTASWADIGDQVNEPAAAVHRRRGRCCRSCC